MCVDYQNACTNRKCFFLFLYLQMLYLDRVVFIERIMQRQFSTMSTWTNEDIKRRIEAEYRCKGFGRGVVEPPLDVAQRTGVEQQAPEDNRVTEIEVVNKAFSSFSSNHYLCH